MQGELVCSGASASSFHLRADDVVKELKKLPHLDVLHFDRKLCSLLADQIAVAQFLNCVTWAQIADTKCDSSSVCNVALYILLF